MVLRQNCGTEKGIVIFDLSGCGFLGKKVRKSESRKRRFICDLSAFLEKGVKGCCVCEKKVVTLQSICAYTRRGWHTTKIIEYYRKLGKIKKIFIGK